MKARTAVTLLITALALRAPAAAEEWLLRLNLEPETRYRLEMVTEQTGQIEAGAGGGSDVASSNRIELSQWLDGVDEAGNLRLAWVYDRVVMESSAGGNQVTIDSAEPSDDPVGEAWARMIGQEVIVVMSPRGEVIAVEGIDEIVQGPLDALPDSPETQGIKQLMAQSFGEEQIKYLMQASVAVYPEEAIAIGDRWEFDLQMENPLMGKVNVLNSYQATALDSTEFGACLAADVSIEMEFESGGMLNQLTEIFRQQGADVKVDVDLNVEDARGDICVDLATGLVSRMRQELDLLMTMDMQLAMGDQPQTLEMVMDMTVTTVLRVLSAEPLVR